MNKLTRITVSILVSIIILFFYTCTSSKSSDYIIVSETGCCAIKVEKLTEESYLVTWIDNTGLDQHYEQYIEIEYPDEDMSDEEALELEVEWAIDEAMDYCYTHHNH